MKPDRLIEHKPKPITCKICGKCFDDETDLVTHELTVHPNVGSTELRIKESSKKSKAA